MNGKEKRLGPCPLCGREMVDGASVNDHHWVPKSRGGTETAVLHKVCHRMIHEIFTEKELATGYATPEALRQHPDIAAFVTWIRKKPADYVDWPKSPRTKKKGRKKPSPIVYPTGRKSV